MGGNIFDKMQINLHGTVNDTFGYAVRWVSQEGAGPVYIAKCLRREPTKEYRLGEVKYSPNFFEMEYRAGDLPGLYESARKGDVEEVWIYDIGTDYTTGSKYITTKGHATWDGKTYKIMIEKTGV